MTVLCCIPNGAREGKGEKFLNVVCQRFQIAPIRIFCHSPTQLEMHQHQIQSNFFRRSNRGC